MSNRAVDLGALFADLQTELCAGQSLVRKHSTHEGAKGDASEFNWTRSLRDFLPNRYSVESAFVIDCEGQTSDQQDIVIFDRQYTPFILKREGLIYVPAEGVYTVIEVKQSLNKEHVEYAAGKAASVRWLKCTSVAINHAGGQFKPKIPFHIPAGVVALSSDWSPPLGCSFEDSLLHTTTVAETRIDYGCVLSAGAFRVSCATKSKLTKSRKEVSLMHFLLTVFHTLQQLATVPAIDVMAYAKWLDA